MSYFRGEFSGVLYDIEKDKWIIYTNHVGDYPVFYSITDENIYFSSSMDFLLEALKKNNE